eukprot:m.314138 g.314138  ORF g.314138 m.314138 type:complete len:309 (-) comp20263_c1_seq8:965-1891(-)
MGRFMRSSAPRLTATIENTVCFGDDYDDRFASPISDEVPSASRGYAADTGVTDAGYFEVGSTDSRLCGTSTGNENTTGYSPTKSRSTSPRRRKSSFKSNTALKPNANIFNTGGSSSAIIVKLPNDAVDDEDSDDDDVVIEDGVKTHAGTVTGGEHDGGDSAATDSALKWAALDREAALRLVCPRTGVNSTGKENKPYARPRGGHGCVANNSCIGDPSGSGSALVGANKRALRTSVPETADSFHSNTVKSADLPWVAALGSRDDVAVAEGTVPTIGADANGDNPFGPPVLSLNDPFKPAHESTAADEEL